MSFFTPAPTLGNAVHVLGPKHPTVLNLILRSLVSAFNSSESLILENAALRHQIAVLQRNCSRPALRWRDRAFWDILCSIWPGWRNALYIVQPDTVVRWHRQGFRFYWRWKSRHRLLCVALLCLDFIVPAFSQWRAFVRSSLAAVTCISPRRNDERRREVCRESGQIETVGVHHLGPCCHKILHKLFLVVVLRINLSVGAKYRV